MQEELQVSENRKEVVVTEEEWTLRKFLDRVMRWRLKLLKEKIKELEDR